MTVDKALASGLIVPGAALTPYQILEIIDELFACEATSYTGASVAHTLYTCVYLHRLSLVYESCPLLCAYIFLLLKGVELTRSVIIAADIYTEEDFFYNLSHIKLGDMNVPANFRNGYSTALPPPAAPAAAATEKTSELYAGLSVEELLLQFTVQERAIEVRLRELRAAAESTGTPIVESDLMTPATADSSELHIYTLLKNRFDYRRAWYHFHLFMRQPPFHLRTNLQRVASYEAILNSSLSTMLVTIGGSSWREEEELRIKSEADYQKVVADLLAAYAADPTTKPEFPKSPSPHLPPRALTFGFHADIVKCIIQNAPPRVINILYRRDAVCLMQEMMMHVGVMHQLPRIAVNQTFHDIVRWFESFHALNPNILLRSHLWLYMQHSGNKGDASQDPSLDLFAFLQEDAPTSASSPAGGSGISLRDNVKEMLLKSHMRTCASIERYAQDLLSTEAARKHAGLPPHVWNPAKDPFTYSVFLDRCIIPYFNYFKVLLGNVSEYRRKVLSTDANADVNLILDWNILMTDAQMVDSHDWAPKYMEQENQTVALPPGITPQMRGSHPSLYFHHNCYSLAMDHLTHLMSSYILFGLESALYTAKEVPIVMWYLEYALDLHTQNNSQRYRDRNELLALRAVKTKKIGAKKPTDTKKLPMPMQMPARHLPLSYHYSLREAQQNTARGLIQMIEGLKRLKFTIDGKEQHAVIVPAIEAELVRHTCATHSAERDLDATFAPHSCLLV